MTGIEFLRFCAELFSAAAGRTHFWKDCSRKAGIADARDYEIRTYSKGCVRGLVSRNPS